MANSSADKCIFVQILYHACQSYWKRKEGSAGKTGQAEKGQESQLQLQVAPGPVDGTPPSVSTTQPAQVKSRVTFSRPEFTNCQSKLTRGNCLLSLKFSMFEKSKANSCTVFSNAGGCSMNLAIYRCKALVNHMKNKVAAKKKSAHQKYVPFIS